MKRSMHEGWISSTMELSTQAEETAGESVPGKLENITRLFISGIDGISKQHPADPDAGRSPKLVRLMVRSLAAALDRPAGAA